MSSFILLVLTAAHVAIVPPVALKITVTKASITAGQIPTFDVSVRNLADEPARVIAADRSEGLQRWYFRPVVTRAGKEVWLPQGCDLPAPPHEADYLILPSHGTYSFRLSSFSGAWEELKPGIYSVRIRYRHWRYREQSYTSESNAVVLRILAK